MFLSFSRTSWCVIFASISAVCTTKVCDGPLGAVMVELMPSWFTARPRSAAWDISMVNYGKLWKITILNGKYGKLWKNTI